MLSGIGRSGRFSLQDGLLFISLPWFGSTPASSPSNGAPNNNANRSFEGDPFLSKAATSASERAWHPDLFPRYLPQISLRVRPHTAPEQNRKQFLRSAPSEETKPPKGLRPWRAQEVSQQSSALRLCRPACGRLPLRSRWEIPLLLHLPPPQAWAWAKACL